MPLKPNRVWRARPWSTDIAAELEHELGVTALIARLMVARGVGDADDGRRFLAKRLADCHRPELLDGMDAAAERLAAAVRNRETVLIHGDYDVDGSTSTVLMTSFLRACNHDAIPWIPHRRIDGYGLGESSMQAVREHGAKVMVTVDCGIADHGWAKRIEAETGCSVIITDHHLPQGPLPDCTAVVNPNKGPCTYPEKGLAGVGVAWKLCWATAEKLCGNKKLPGKMREFLLDAMALVAVGTVADCAPLTGENRILVHHGLKYLTKTGNFGLKALLEQAKVGPEISADDIGWRIGPLLNASGRLGSAMRNVHLLMARDPAEANKYLQEIVQENEERKRLSQDLTEDLVMEVENNRDRYLKRNGLVFAGEGWHQGVVGIVASRLCEKFGKPTAVIAIEDGTGKGSLRTVPAVHLAQAVESCAEHLIKGGGHAMAAGISIEPDKVQAFADAFDRVVGEQTPAGLPPPAIDHDGKSRVCDLDSAFWTELPQLGPFGQGNPEPVIRLHEASFVTRPELFGRAGDHLRGAVTDTDGGMVQLLAWRSRDRYDDLSSPGGRFEFLVRPQLNYYRGNVQERLVLVDGGTPDTIGS